MSRNKLDHQRESELRERIKKVSYRGFNADLHRETGFNRHHLSTIINGIGGRRITPTTYYPILAFVERLESEKISKG